MFLAEDIVATTEKTPVFTGFDIFVILFTIVLAWGVFRQLKAPVKNKFAIAFGGLALLVFLVVDVVMVANWLGLLEKA